MEQLKKEVSEEAFKGGIRRRSRQIQELKKKQKYYDTLEQYSLQAKRLHNHIKSELQEKQHTKQNGGMRYENTAPIFYVNTQKHKTKNRHRNKRRKRRQTKRKHNKTQ